ncbi:hypothetical protein [Pseudoruegeria sp. HB172150]|uniref:hypothetical protein n=1 Tax=Pseudoruegeria sp. HB172150 TaxID=2721164 RepID=UPI001554474A|nr:hypothetical protein [Pseudoruegeria sp. HB172150]
MYYLEASALRIGPVIEITISGMLPNSCWEARVSDFYPGGNIVYAIDPGAAQVFIAEELKSGSGFCTLSLVPWVRTVSVPDQGHKKVQIFVNGKQEREVEVTGKGDINASKGDIDQFRVISLTGGLPEHVGCSVIPADAFFPSIYTSVFGPDTFASCQAWMAKNCTAPSK